MRSTYSSEPIVTVGTGCRFPGGINSPSKLWEAVCSKKDLLTQIPLSRFNTKGFYHSNGERHGSTNVEHAYLLTEDVSGFDASFFGIHPREAEAIDPQQRLLLETVYEAMEDGGLTITGMKGSDTAVYVGLMTGDYHELQIRDPEKMPMYMATGTARSIVSNRVSYFFDWKGPSMTIDTACSSSLVALHHAVQSLRAGECKTAVAAGANLILGPEMMIAESKLHMLSPTGRSRMWDAEADGYARGEGFAAVVLKTLSQALADGDHVEYIIRETGVNQDGRTQGITMPSASSQTALIQQTYCKAGLDCTRPEDRCQFFEAHGTGTPRGDPIEARAIRDAFFPDPAEGKPFYVGSVKTVIGHLEGCAGLAGLLKAAEAVRRAQIPPNMHFNRINPDILPLSQKLQVPTKVLPWPDEKAPRRASVNSFGFGGTNAHVIIESYDQPSVTSSLSTILPVPLTFSAASQSSLLSLVQNYVTLLQSNDISQLHDLAVTLASRRSQHSARVTFSGASKEKLLQNMESALHVPSIGEQKQPSSTSTRILGVFTGQGAQWPGMGREVILASPMAQETIRNMQTSLDNLPDGPIWSIKDKLTNAEELSQIQEAALSQPLCTAVQVILVDLLRAANVSFHTVVGHSSGEIGAAYAAGLISAEDAIRIAYYRGVSAKMACGGDGIKGAMMAVSVSFDEAQDFIISRRFEGRIAVAASNAPQSVTLAGDEDAITEAKGIFDAQQTFCRLLKVDTAYHSHHMRPCLELYCAALQACHITPLTPVNGCNWISSVHGRSMTTGEESDSLKETYWADNMANTVLFSQALQTATRCNGPFVIGVEVGPHPALKGPVTQTTKQENGIIMPYCGTLSRFSNDTEAISDALGFLWKELGADSVDLSSYSDAAFGLKCTKGPVRSLPSYAWDHNQRFWKESYLSRNYRQRPHIRHDLLGVRCPDDHDHHMRWRNTLRVSEVPWLSGHKVQGQIIFPAAGYLVMAMEAAKELAKDSPIGMVELQDVHISRAIALSEDNGVEIMFHMKPMRESETPHLAEFSCYSATVDERDIRWQQNVSGRVQVRLLNDGPAQLPPRQEDAMSLVPVNMETFYSSLTEIGLEYTGLFQRLDRVVRRARRATGFTKDIASDTETPAMIHPAMLDASFQTIFAAFCWPGDGSLCAPAACEEMIIDCSITEALDLTVTADVDIFTPHQPRIQLEGLTCTVLNQASAADDCELFAETVWEADAEAGPDPSQLVADSSMDLLLVDLCERLSYSYLRRLNDTIDRDELSSFVWYHRRIFEFIDYLFPLIERGQHPTICKKWIDDSHEWLLSQAQRYQDQVDLQLISAVGENLVKVVRGETTMLEHMIENDTLNRFYKYGLGFQRANGAISRLARQIAHRYPRMNILEIGAGTGGATQGLLEHLDDTFSNYVFTDISTGFFEKAQEQFQRWGSKMAFKALNIEEDLATQGFENGSFDLVIASNVLHATKNLDHTMRNVRKLLKPGGYLLLLEVTSEILRVKLMMSGLQGWWLGDTDGRRFAPTITASQWNELLIKTGFSGVDQRVTDFQDLSKHMTSVMLSQAVNGDIALLKDPLANTHPPLPVDRVAIIGGQTPAVRALAEQTTSMLSRWSTYHPLFFTRFEEFVERDAVPITSIVSLADLEEPLLCNLNPDKLVGVQRALDECRQILWVTSGCRDQNPYANMTIGLGRSLMYEHPHIRMQFLDLACGVDGQASRVATALARLIVADKLDLPSERVLWSVEPELAFQEHRLMIPRILPNYNMNNRLNSSRRKIMENTCLADMTVEISAAGRDICLYKMDTTVHSRNADNISIHVHYSLLHGLHLYECTTTYLSIGKIEKPDSSNTHPAGTTVLALCHHNSSAISVPSAQVVRVDSSSATPDMLLCTALSLLMNTVLKQVAPQGHILVVDPDIKTQRLIEDRALLMDLSVTVVSFKPGQKGTVYVPQYLSKRHLATRLPSTIDVTFNCCKNENHPLKAFLDGRRTIHLADLFQLPSTRHDSISNGPPMPSHEELLEACEVSQAHIKPGNDATLVSASELGGPPSIPPDYSLVVDFTRSQMVQTRVQPINAQGLFRSDRSYLLVGCTGGLGQSLTRWMVQNGARYLILTSRNLKRVDRVWLEELKCMGACVRLYELDVSNKPALDVMYEEVQDQLPPIAGVANAAMVLSDRLFSDMTVEHLQTVLQPKVAGTAYLDEIFSTPALDFFILFSSLASIVGNRGQSNYGAANLFMASLAARRKRQGLAGSVLDIGMVLGIGYVSQTGIYESTLRKFHYMPISEPKFHTMFTEAIVAGRPDNGTQAEIITGLHRISELGDSGENAFWSGNPRLSHYTIQEDAGKEQVSTTLVSLKRQLADICDSTEASQIVLDAFLAKLGRVLQVEISQINPVQPLINLGVDSLMAVEVRSWFLKEIDMDMPVLRVLGGASPEELCNDAAQRFIDAKTPMLSCASSPAHSELSAGQVLDGSQVVSSATSATGPVLEGFKDEESEKVPEDMPLDKQQVDRLSFAQERLWFLRAFLQDPSTYNVTMMYRLRGPSAIDLSNAFNVVVARHHSLRSAFFVDQSTAVPSQKLLRTANFTLCQRMSTEGKDEINQEFQRLCYHSYRLEHGETMAATLFSHSPDTHTLVLGFHHIVFDGFSAQVLIKDLTSALSGDYLPPLKHHYVDFAYRQRALMQSDMADDIAFWKTTFSTLPAPLPLFDFCQVKTRKALTAYTLHSARRSIPSATVTSFKSTVRGFSTTAFHGHLAVLQILLSRLLDVSEVCIGITDANRTDRDFLETIGFFVNLLPLRFHIGVYDSLEELLHNTRDVAYQALQRSRVPFDVLLGALDVPRSTTESPLFQILMNYKMGSASSVHVNGIDAELLQFEDARNPYDLIFDIEEQSEGTTLVSLKSQSYLYSKDDLRLILDCYTCLLESCSSNPNLPLDKHRLYSDEDARATLALGKGPRFDHNIAVTLTHRIDLIADRYPNQIAVKDHEGNSLTYRQMLQRVQLIAATLEANGVRPSDFVAVYCEPTMNSVCYLLAVWRLNAVYVPLDPQNPVQRLQLILDDCHPAAIIYHAPTEQAMHQIDLLSSKPVTFCDFPFTSIPSIPNRSSSLSPACALYTSGSTGVPKGIVLTHANLVNQIMSIKRHFGIKREISLQQSSLGFDVSLDQMLQPLIAGGTLIAVPRHLRGDAVELARLMLAENVTYTYATPSEYAALLRYGAGFLGQSESWRIAFVGGEALPTHLIRSFHALKRPGLRLINRYGPTEITVSSCCLSIDTYDPATVDISTVSVGYTLPNYSTYILSANGSPVPVGFVGEIVVGGSGVARGYLGKDALTRQRFLLDTFAGPDDIERGFTSMYRTGDKGRLLPNGELIYLGRMDGDSQIKLRGFRVELDDIANTILRVADGRLADAAVSVRGTHDEDGDRRFLVAFTIPSMTSNTGNDLHAFLKRLLYRLPLPPYMIPRLILPVENLPRNPNGKLDRGVLDQLPLSSAPEDVSPQDLSEAQQTVVRVWKCCLDESSLPSSWSPSTDFFQLGGNSLLIIRVQAMLREASGRQIPLPDLFQSSTVERMAALLTLDDGNYPVSQIDWHVETMPGEMEELQFAIPAPFPCPPSKADHGIEVCLTGSTGFLGSALLRHFVADSRVSRIHCIAIRHSNNSCTSRTLAIMSDKIVQYAGDLRAPRLGVDLESWKTLAAKVDVIIHNGADVSFLKSYQSLQKANVQSTRELACIAFRRQIPLHFVSTGGVSQLARVESLPPRSVANFRPPVDGSNGYVASKWASEAYLEECAARFHLPCTIHRPSNIVGDGVPSTDLIQTIFQISVKIRAVPTTENWTGYFDFVAVEDVAAKICQEVFCSLDESKKSTDGATPKQPQIFHHCGDEKIPVGGIQKYLEDQNGLSLRTVDVDSWLDAARNAGLSGVLESLVTATLKNPEGCIIRSLSRN
ncbi:putative Nonribosomal peptide synthetase [Aspergillus tanneri]|uniref:Putative Nonribosomal peptide synthetase n=1 Tax=Aspergillus tanneri TaxID=1220188 RepID=A0A5M9MU47_9EURO|nr:putative Nonribosomal peptide synthetase [Aspergillus tanneri]KAA8649476.1 putative Nonribosomal peptide synthetase [Aspergillus tanneri]